MGTKMSGPMSVKEATEYLQRRLSAEMFTLVDQEMTVVEFLTYAETLRLHERIDAIEAQADEMMSPEKMMELASGFLGSGAQPSILG